MNKFLTLLFSSSLFLNTSCKNDDLTESPSPRSIAEIRSTQLTDTQKFGETSITAVVVSAPDNTESGIVAVQQKEAKAGILLELVTAQNFAPDDEVEINLKGASLHTLNGELRVRNLSSVQVIKTGETFQTQPLSSNIKEASTNAAQWGPILISLNKLTMSSESEVLAGKNTITDSTGSCYMTVMASSGMAAASGQANIAQLIGIVRLRDTDAASIFPRSKSDLLFPREGFELGSTSGYTSELVEFLTGSWVISGGIVATSDADAKNGDKSIRLRGNTANLDRLGMAEMQFDISGVKGVKFYYGLYPASGELANENNVALSVEYSLDKGENYQLLGTVAYDVDSYVGPSPAADILREAEFSFSDIGANVDASQSVRFKIVNASEPLSGSTFRPRLNIDDFTFVY